MFPIKAPDTYFLCVFPHIKKFVDSNWGTVELKNYFDTLLSDTRNGNRKGFPMEILSEILKLSQENIEYLKSIGIDFEECTASDFAPTDWKLPKNF